MYAFAGKWTSIKRLFLLACMTVLVQISHGNPTTSQVMSGLTEMSSAQLSEGQKCFCSIVWKVFLPSVTTVWSSLYHHCMILLKYFQKCYTICGCTQLNSAFTAHKNTFDHFMEQFHPTKFLQSHQSRPGHRPPPKEEKKSLDRR